MGRARRAGRVGHPSAQARARVLEYAAGRLLAPETAGDAPGGLGGVLDAVGSVLDTLVSAFAAQGALVLAPGSARPLGEAAVRPGDLLDDLVLLAQMRAAWARQGREAAAAGRDFEVDLDSGRHRGRLLVVPAPAPGGRPACALALIGDVPGWGTGARDTLRALATMVATLPACGVPGARGVRSDQAVPPVSSVPPVPPVPPVGTGGSGAPAAGRPADLRPSPASTDSLAAALVAGAPAAIIAVDSDRRIREFNPSAEELFGRTRAEAIGLDMPETLVPERYRQGFIDAMAGYLATGDRSSFTRRIRLRALRADGTEPPVELTPMPVTVGGETYFFGFLRDATELEDAEIAVAEGDARFRLLSSLAPVGIVQSDVDGTCRFVNDKWSEMTGIPASEVIGQNWRTTVNASDVARLDAMRNQSRTTELSADCRLRTAAGGGETWVHAVVRRVEDADGNLVGRVVALTDVNARKVLEAAAERDRRKLTEQNVELRGLNAAVERDRRKLSELSNELRDLNDEKARYLATVSHELRTPLTSVVSFAELMRSEIPDLGADAAEYLDIIQRNAERLLRVVGDLLDLEGLERGVARLEMAAVSVPDVTRYSGREGWATAAGDGVELDVFAQDGPAVRADGSRLQQVLDNLISNAVKFSASGGHVEVRATHDAREWRIDVADHGMGIPPGEVDRLFDRFFRASNARDDKVPGTGLGLPTAKAITELHGGRIEVASTVGSGTTFTVYLPIGT